MANSLAPKMQVHRECVRYKPLLAENALHPCRWSRWFASVFLWAIVLFSAGSAAAQFSTVINLPTDAPPKTIFSGTQLNVFDAGLLPSSASSPFRARGGEVNVYGGEVGSFYRGHDDSVLNVYDGFVVGSLTAYENSSINMYGGLMGSFRLFDNGAALLSGGSVSGPVLTRPDTSLTMIGGEFRVDGSMVDGLDVEGSSVVIDLDDASSLSGVLEDGTPFVFSRQDGDEITDGTLTLRAAQLPFAEPTEILLPRDPTPTGIRNGQTIVVGEGGVVGQSFAAVWGSSMQVLDGGFVGSKAEVIGTHVTISGGEVDTSFQAFDGTTVEISGGVVSGGFSAYRGSEVNISGGEVGGGFRAWDGSHVRIVGGTVGVGFRAFSGSEVEIQGGNIGNRLLLSSGSKLILSGGRLGDGIGTSSGSHLRLAGNEFELDGVPIEGFGQVGNLIQFDLPAGTLLTGVLTDGTPIAISSNDNDQITAGTLFLEAAELRPIDELMFEVPNDVPPNGLRKGQSLLLRGGGSLSDNFTALANSTVQIAGGSIANNFEAIGTIVEINSGVIGNHFDAFLGTQVDMVAGQLGDFASVSEASSFKMADGSIGEFLDLAFGSTLTMLGGTVGNHLSARNGSKVIISGGSVGDSFIIGSVPLEFIVAPGTESGSSTSDGRTVVSIFDGQVGASLSVYDNGFVNIYGGEIGDDLTTNTGSTLNIYGGEFGDSFSVESGSKLHLFGTSFMLDGQPIDGLSIGVDFVLQSRDVVLSALLTDGSMLEVDLMSARTGTGDFFSEDATVTLTLLHSVPEPSTSIGLLIVSAVAATMRFRIQ